MLARKSPPSRKPISAGAHAGSGLTSSLISIAGGDDVFPELARESLGKNRIIADPLEVPRRRPDLIIGSWCGKKFVAEKVASQPGWDAIPAVRDGQLHEIKSPLILQPGPAAKPSGLAGEAIQQRLRFEELLSSLSARFINLPPDRIDQAHRVTIGHAHSVPLEDQLRRGR